MQPITAKNAMRAVSVTLLLAFSPFSCKPPRTFVLDEGKIMGTPKPAVVMEAKKDAGSAKEDLHHGDTSIVPVPQKTETSKPIVKDTPKGKLTIYPNGMEILEKNEGGIEVLKLPKRELKKLPRIQ